MRRTYISPATWQTNIDSKRHLMAASGVWSWLGMGSADSSAASSESPTGRPAASSVSGDTVAVVSPEPKPYLWD